MLDRPTPAEPPPGLPKEEIEALQKTILGLARLLAPEQDAHAYAAFATIWAAIVRLCWLAVAHALRQTVAQLPPASPVEPLPPPAAAPGLCEVRGPGLDRITSLPCVWPPWPHTGGTLCHFGAFPDPALRPVGPLCLPLARPQPPAIDWIAVTMPPPLLDTEGAVSLLRQGGKVPPPPVHSAALLLQGYKAARDAALADVAQLLDYLRERRDCPHDPGRLVFCSECGKLATLRHTREFGRYLCDDHAQLFDLTDLEGAAGCFQVARVAALLEAHEKHGARAKMAMDGRS